MQKRWHMGVFSFIQVLMTRCLGVSCSLSSSHMTCMIAITRKAHERLMDSTT